MKGRNIFAAPSSVAPRENTLRRLLCHQDYTWVRESSLCRDGIELDLALLGRADQLEAVTRRRVIRHHGRDGDEARAFQRHHFHERWVIELGNHQRLEALVAKPIFQRAPHRGVFRRHQSRCAVKRSGKTFAQEGRERARAAEREARFPEQMTEGAECVTAGSGLVREDGIEAVHGELCDQVGNLAFAADDMHRLRQIEDRLENFVGGELRK